MLELKGKYTNAKVFTDNIEETAVGQVIGMISDKLSEDTQVRIMPDVHAGKGSTVGTTIKFKDGKITRAVPNVVGVDIGCGIFMTKLADVDVTEVDFEKLDEVVNKYVPSGFGTHQTEQPRGRELAEKLRLELDEKKIGHIARSVGTLGGGNHYIELAQTEEGELWLSVHSGSRNLGLQVAQSYQKIAEANFKEGLLEATNKDLAYLEGQDLDDYLHDMVIAQDYAKWNRARMISAILTNMGWKQADVFDSIHNFISVEEGIIRKGATSAREGERLVIPLNMRDGSLICEGLGNEDWNFSAPHGAGRVLSRSKARKELDLDEYIEQMKDVYTTSVQYSTIDEAPNAYKPAHEIIDNIKDTAKVIHHLKPLYNFKAK